jgi:ABC-2 type transport system permease protein
MLLPTAVGPMVFHHYHPFDVPPVLAGYLGMVLLGAAFIAAELFVSSLTENQVVSAMVTYGIIVLFWFLTWNERPPPTTSCAGSSASRCSTGSSTSRAA